jgi:hypothetical protein
MKDCWCTDEQGRVVILLDNTLMFQRYTEGDTPMQTSSSNSNWESVSATDINTFLTQL